MTGSRLQGRVEARVKTPTAPHTEIGLDCGGYSLGDALDVRVNVSAGVLSVSVNGHSVEYTPPFNAADRFYFKAGDCKPNTQQNEERGGLPV